MCSRCVYAGRQCFGAHVNEQVSGEAKAKAEYAVPIAGIACAVAASKVAPARLVVTVENRDEAVRILVAALTSSVSGNELVCIVVASFASSRRRTACIYTSRVVCRRAASILGWLRCDVGGRMAVVVASEATMAIYVGVTGMMFALTPSASAFLPRRG